MSLFKYMPKRYLEAYMAKGSLKIGTLYEYRQVEKYGHVIGDKNEGLHKTELFLPNGGEIQSTSNTPEGIFIRQHLLNPEQQDMNFRMILEKGARIIAESHSQDLFVYCITSEFNPEVMKEFGCDSCLEITRPEEFFHAISRKIRHTAKFEGCFSITYASKLTHYSKPHEIHPATMKDTEYEYQKECRAIWIPHKASCNPIFVDVPRAIRFCRPIYPGDY